MSFNYPCVRDDIELTTGLTIPPDWVVVPDVLASVARIEIKREIRGALVRMFSVLILNVQKNIS